MKQYLIASDFFGRVVTSLVSADSQKQAIQKFIKENPRDSIIAITEIEASGGGIKNEQ